MTSKQADAKDRRHRMTQQRRNLSNKIRKQKRSEFLSKKRNLATGDSYNSSESMVRDLMLSYVQSPNEGNLQALEKALPMKVVNGSEEKPLLYLPPEEESFAIQLLECLNCHAIVERKLFTICLQVLVKLTAISHHKSVSEESYYGRMPCSWCVIMIQNSTLIETIIKHSQNYESCILILGNLVGDPSSAQVCPALRQSGMVPALITCIQDEQLAAVWALTNAIRNDTATWASEYCSDSLLSASMLEEMLKSTSPRIRTQAAWMVASLTSREEAVVQYLVSHSTFCSTLLACVERPDVENKERVPLLQALGSIATYEANVILFLHTLPSLIPTLIHLLQAPHTNKDLLIQIVWLVGCLFVDARIENHPSTVQAPQIIPVLFQLIQKQELSLEERRDIAYALWNALTLPPSCDVNPNLTILPPTLPNKQLVRSSLASLAGLLGSPDSDAVMASVNVLNLVLRHDESLQIFMEEENIQSALEDLCESTMDDAAEIAADLLDDYFYRNDDNDESMVLQSTNANGTFSFGGFPDPVQPSLNGLGMGRGRGMPLVPSWVKK
jgi:hypothetical protein